MTYLTEADPGCPVKFCKQCENCFEIRSTSLKNMKKALKENTWENVYNVYSDFPKIGKEKKRCPKCVASNNCIELLKDCNQFFKNVFKVSLETNQNIKILCNGKVDGKLFRLPEPKKDKDGKVKYEYIKLTRSQRNIIIILQHNLKLHTKSGKRIKSFISNLSKDFNDKMINLGLDKVYDGDLNSFRFSKKVNRFLNDTNNVVELSNKYIDDYINKNKERNTIK